VGLDEKAENVSFKALNMLGGVLDQKAFAEDHLKKSGLDYVILRPGIMVENKQGEMIFGKSNTFIGSNTLDEFKDTEPVKCESPFMAASGQVCSVTRKQVAEVIVASLEQELPEEYDGIIEMVARPDAPQPEPGHWFDSPKTAKLKPAEENPDITLE